MILASDQDREPGAYREPKINKAATWSETDDGEYEVYKRLTGELDAKPKPGT